jgi:hypothetical protein
MAASREQLLDSLSVGTQTSGRWTEFHYPVSVEAPMVARAISDLSRIAIPVIAFNRKIRAIELSGNVHERYELLAEDHINPNCTLLKMGDPENEGKSYHLAVATDDEVAIAVPLEQENGFYGVVSPTDVPRLFVAFPLFGTESVPFPFIMNSVQAIPTFYGGTANAGTVFKLTPNKDDGWNESVLYSFTGNQDGAYPNAGLIFDGAGKRIHLKCAAGGGGAEWEQWAAG